jgi:hypothetical protein
MYQIEVILQSPFSGQNGRLKMESNTKFAAKKAELREVTNEDLYEKT